MSAEYPDAGGDMHNGTAWRRCPRCHLRVWLTKRGKPCRHLPEPNSYAPLYAALGSGAPASVARCEASS
jgi:hypothetical protein